MVSRLPANTDRLHVVVGWQPIPTRAPGFIYSYLSVTVFQQSLLSTSYHLDLLHSSWPTQDLSLFYVQFRHGSDPS